MLALSISSFTEIGIPSVASISLELTSIIMLSVYETGKPMTSTAFTITFRNESGTPRGTTPIFREVLVNSTISGTSLSLRVITFFTFARIYPFSISSPSIKSASPP